VGRREVIMWKSQGPFAFGLGRKPPEARARDDIVLSIMPACCCVYVYWGNMAREVNKRHHMAAAAVLWTSPLVFGFSLVCSLVCGTTLTTKPNTHPPVQVCHVALLQLYRLLWLVYWWWVPPLRSGVRCSMNHHRARPASPLFWSCPWAH